MVGSGPKTAKAAAAAQFAGDTAAAPCPAPAGGADDLTAALSALFLFDGLTAEEKAALFRAGQIRRQSVARGTVVFDRGHAEQALVLVLDGRLQVLQGRVVMNELCAGQVFGAAALFDTLDGESGMPYPSTVKAATDARLAFIPQATVTAWMRLCPRVAENYIRFLSGRIRFLNRRLTTLTAGQADDRLWRWLTAHRAPDGTVVLPGGMTALAAALGVGRSSLYRSLDALIEEGRIVRRDRHTFLIEGSAMAEE